MKKIISLILMCVMLLCIVSCKRRPQDDVRADIPAQSSGDAADGQEDKTDKEKTEDKPAENADDNKNDINTENKKDLFPCPGEIFRRTISSGEVTDHRWKTAV